MAVIAHPWSVGSQDILFNPRWVGAKCHFGPEFLRLLPQTQLQMAVSDLSFDTMSAYIVSIHKNEGHFAQLALGVVMSLTPVDLKIRPRRMDFGLPDPLPRHWHSNDPFKTHFFNAMSVLFPDGERYFIDSVRPFRAKIKDPVLLEQISGFIGQEGHHSREHIDYNNRLRALGYNIDRLEMPVKRRIRFVQKQFSAERQLAGTVAMEHFTAILANALLSEPQWLAQASPEMQKLWRWHALEETEHKAVAFDVYMQVCGDRKILRRAMRQATFFFLKDVTKGTLHMLKKDGKLTLSVWCKGMLWLWGRQGFFTRLIPAYRDFYRNDFHPWQHNNAVLMEQVAKEFELQPA